MSLKMQTLFTIALFITIILYILLSPPGKAELLRISAEDAGLVLSSDYKLINYAEEDIIDPACISKIKIPDNSIKELKKQIMDRAAGCSKYEYHELSTFARNTSWWKPENEIFTTKYISKFSGIYIVISKDKDGTFLYIESKYLY